MAEKTVGTTEAAKQLGVSKKTLLKWCSERRISYIRYPGGQFRFRESTIDIFQARHTVPATNPMPTTLRKAA
jgi:excisionase family DNA binding protein